MSKIEVDEIDKQSGSTLTLGGSGTAVTLASGATQSGFGRAGTVDWQTSIKTASFTAVSGEGYFVNTTSGAITVTLPASPSAGDIVSIKDYAQTFDTNNCTVGRNSEPIEGKTFNLVLDTEGIAITLIYGDATKGWQSVNSNEVTNTQKFIAATGGTVTTCGDFKIHTFTGPGCFTVTCGGNAQGSNKVSYMVVAGGGGGGSAAGGGGAGGFREGKAPFCAPYTASPIACTSGSNAGLPVLVQSYPITVGGGGAGGAAGSDNAGSDGVNSVFSTITSTGGGGGESYGIGVRSGGSGGGAAPSPGGRTGGAGNTPPVSPPQGNPGGPHTNPSPVANYSGTGGGGATAAGPSVSTPNTAGPGGAGATTSISGSPTAYAGGGGGSTLCSGTAGTGGTGGGADGKNGASAPYVGNNGTANTGGGAGAGTSPCFASPTRGGGGTGGSGVVIIRYKFQ
ncbi:hypothetical protein HTVC023P_gp59 [Pelagibacter phage HTVC023P]|nr:hypothetical protein HTVC023P_gp59 [Pelagibacter phage HTVC023P]